MDNLKTLIDLLRCPITGSKLILENNYQLMKEVTNILL